MELDFNNADSDIFAADGNDSNDMEAEIVEIAIDSSVLVQFGSDEMHPLT